MTGPAYYLALIVYTVIAVAPQIALAIAYARGYKSRRYPALARTKQTIFADHGRRLDDHAQHLFTNVYGIKR